LKSVITHGLNSVEPFVEMNVGRNMIQETMTVVVRTLLRYPESSKMDFQRVRFSKKSVAVIENIQSGAHALTTEAQIFFMTISVSNPDVKQ